MKKLMLYNTHQSLGAKMIDFAGFSMPVQYDGVKIEHSKVRNSVGVFDVSHMGQIFVSGNGSEDFLQYITSNDVSKIKIGQVQYTCFPNHDGGIVDDLLLYKLGINYYMLVVNASNIEKDLNWMIENNKYNVEIQDESDHFSLLAVQGPKSIELLQSFTDYKLSNIKYYNFIVGNICGIDDVIISRTGYTGELGFELYVKNNDIKILWDTLFTSSIDLSPIGLAARDTLRLEKGFCLYGNDIDDTTSPIEAGLGWITKFSKKFINSDQLLKQKREGVLNQLVGLELLDKGIARKDHLIFDINGQNVGRITSGTMSPTLDKAISMAYLKTEYISKEIELFVQVRNKKIRAKIVNLPFL